MSLIKYILYSFAIAIALVSCKKEDLFLPPKNAIDATQAFSTPDRIDKAAVGIYDALQNGNFFGGRVLIYADMRGLDVVPNTYFGQMGFFNTTTASDGTVTLAWQGAYNTIFAANYFMQGMEANRDKISAAKADQYIGEAKFVRSLVYFYLVNLWAQPYQFTNDASHPGVPLILKPATAPFDVVNQIPRATVKQVYDQIEADLLDAEAKLPSPGNNAFEKVARATKGAARALLSRLYLYKRDYVKANQYADLVIGMNAYVLNQNPVTTFRTPYTTPESIFSVAMNGSDNPNTNNSLGQHYNPDARGDLSVSAEYISLMNTTTDLRYTQLINRLNNGSYWTTKYAGITNDFVPVLRYAEVLLTKAEALARTASGIDPTALQLLMTVRDRSNGGPLVISSRDELIAAIIKERRIELAFEGHGILEFQRLGLDLPAHSTVPAQAFGSHYRVLPIPKYDLDKNPNLVPNPGY